MSEIMKRDNCLQIFLSCVSYNNLMWRFHFLKIVMFHCNNESEYINISELLRVS